MGIRGERRRPGSWKGQTGQPWGRMSRGQELTLFIILMAVLLALIIYGMRA